MAGYENRFDSLHPRLTELEGKVNLLTWMVGGVYVFGVPTIWLLVRVAAKVGALG